MKVAILSLILIVFAAVAFADKDFDEWQKKHGKNYATAEHKVKAEKNFKKNDDNIKAHNAAHDAGEETFTKVHNQFSDLSAEEYKEKLLVDFEKIKKDKPSVRSGSTPMTIPTGWTPGQLDTNTCKIPVKDQEYCGSCWAFSATAVLEFRLLSNYYKYFDLSEQNSVDCVTTSAGCSGGWMDEVFDYGRINGIFYESNYLYKGLDGTCKYQSSFNTGLGIAPSFVPQWYTIPNNEVLLAYILSQKGWVSVCLNADALQFYDSGILKASSCTLGPNHAVVLVGYGRDATTGLDYWILRNSWGADWGESGHFRIQRGVNACDINNSYPYYRVHLA